MDATMFLLAAVPIIIVTALLYAVLAEAQHNRTRRSRWEPVGDLRAEAGPVFERTVPVD